MQNKYSREEFKQMMFKFGYTFDHENKYTSKDGCVILNDDHIVCYNKVIYDDFKNYVKLSYPFTFEDEVLISEKYDNDFKYHHSYQSYKDFMNIENKDYTQTFITEIYRYYYRQEVNNDDEWR